ncbi:MAG: glycoside hydrolase family 127 protein [Bacteroidales bacterium]|nr:glycoside hydrolase family 127 protein [Bacteroidales bacterium]
MKNHSTCVPNFIIAFSVFILLSSCEKKADRVSDYPIKPVPFTAVQVTDNFWAPRIKKNHEVTIPIAFRQSEETGRIKNFHIAGGYEEGEFCSNYPFDDSDVYKIIEGASYSLQMFPDPELESYLDTLIFYIGEAQEEDGYLYTYRTIMGDNSHPWVGPTRWEILDHSHELYNLGHMYEAAVAHFQATGKRSFLDIAIKSADLVYNDFGWGKVEKYPGHQEIEIGLVKLFRATGDEKYLELAKFLLDVRGNGEEYNQAHMKVVEQTEAVGHAVRAGYMYAGMADVAALTNDPAYINATREIWEDIVQKKMYITGGIGAAGGNEGFADPYELPNMSAYCETCASIANVFWNFRMFLHSGEVEFYDVLERTLYNGLLSGLGLTGDLFFYPNPLESYGQHQRQEWFGCACCPSNISRFIPSIPGYIYATRENDLFVNMYMANKATIDLNGTPVNIRQDTRYPYDGAIKLILDPEQELTFTLNLRVPGWARNEVIPGDLYHFTKHYNGDVTITVNGEKKAVDVLDGFILLDQTWRKGDIVEVHFSMPVRLIEANELVKADQGRLAVQRGPLVFCAEWPDNPEGHVLNLVFDPEQEFTEEFHPDLLGGTVVLSGSSVPSKRKPEDEIEVGEKQELKLIPYHLWANRGPGEMMVWLPLSVEKSRPLPAPTIASKSKVSASKETKALVGLNDQFEPENSDDRTAARYHWWPDTNMVHWVQYDFEKTETVERVEVYWFDDSPHGGCRIPASWEVEYKSGGSWLPVSNPGEYTVTKDRYDVVKFKPVKTKALRLNVTLQENWSGGILEWKVY